MEQFSKKSINKSEIVESDLGIKVSDLVELVESNILSLQILNLLDIDSIKDEFIKIKGAKTIVDNQKAINSKYKKIDLVSSLSNVSLYNDDVFTINFKKIKDNPYLENLHKSKICTIPIYSAEREFFSGLFQMDRYATKLISNGLSEIVQTNLRLLKKEGVKDRKFRVLHDISEDLFYLRGIISLNKYHNYDNNLCVVLGLLMLHEEMKKRNVSYSLNLCEYNESFIRLFFESSEIIELEKIGHVKNLIEISNDEIKREAFRFLGVCSIVFENETKKIDEIIISPNEVKSKILSIKHNQISKTAVEELIKMNQMTKIHEDLFDDIKLISKISKPEQIKFLIRDKVEKAKRQEIKKIKNEVVKLIDESRISNMIQLLTLFKKIELISEEIEAKEYLRFEMYQALINKK